MYQPRKTPAPKLPYRKPAWPAQEKRGLQQHIGSRIAMAREIAGLTQGELAERIGIGRTQIVNLEAGRSDTGATTLVRIARAIGIKPGRLLP